MKINGTTLTDGQEHTLLAALNAFEATLPPEDGVGITHHITKAYKERLEEIKGIMARQ